MPHVLVRALRLKPTEQTAAVPLDAVKPLPPPPAEEPTPEPSGTSQAEPPPKPAEKPKAASEPAPADEVSSIRKTEKTAAAAVADTIPLPRAKPRQPRKPGDIVKVANRLVPIPVPKPKPQ